MLNGTAEISRVYCLCGLNKTQADGIPIFIPPDLRLSAENSACSAA